MLQVIWQILIFTGMGSILIPLELRNHRARAPGTSFNPSGSVRRRNSYQTQSYNSCKRTNFHNRSEYCHICCRKGHNTIDCWYNGRNTDFNGYRSRKDNIGYIKQCQKGPVGYNSAIIPTENKFMNLYLDIDVKDAVSESIQDSVSDTNQDLNASIHTGKCIRRFGGIYAYCWYFIDRKC